MKRLLRAAVATLFGLLVSSTVLGTSCALGLCLSGGGFNLKSIIYLSVPFALLLGFAAAAQPMAATAGKHRTPLAVLVGAALGLLYTFLLFGLMGWGFLAMYVEALACWIAAGISAMLVHTPISRVRKVSAMVGFCLLGILLPRPLFNVFAHNQQLTVAFVTPSSASEEMVPPRAPILNSGEGAEAVSKRVLEHVHSLGLVGNFRVAYLARQGDGKQGLAIIVVQAPVEQRTLLPEPNGSTVTYVQHSGAWTKYPSDAPTLKRNIEIWPRTIKDEARVYFSIPYAWGSSLVGRIEVPKDRSRNP